MSEIIQVKDAKRFRTVVTDIGNQKIANAALNGEKVNITTAVVTDGGGTYFSPAADMTALENEVWRGEIATKKINPASKNMVDVKIVLDGTVGGFTVRGIGLLDADGDLIAVCNTPDTEKAVILDGAPVTLTMIMHVVFTNADVVEFTVNPSVDNITAADMEAAVKEHNDDPDAHGGLLEKVGEVVDKLTEDTTPIFAGPTEPTAAGPFLWLQVITHEDPDPERPDGEHVMLDIQNYHEGSDLYAVVDEETRSVENARQTTDPNSGEPLKIKIN